MIDIEIVKYDSCIAQGDELPTDSKNTITFDINNLLISARRRKEGQTEDEELTIFFDMSSKLIRELEILVMAMKEEINETK